MTRIKLCGLSREEDIFSANMYRPDYIGFVFWNKSKRCVTGTQAAKLKRLLDKDIQAVGVFVDEDVEVVAKLLKDGVIDIPQLHGNESESYVEALREKTKEGTKIFKAFIIQTKEDVEAANTSSADMVLLDSGKGSGEPFNWDLLKQIERPYILAGGLNMDNLAKALKTLHPYGVDVSSGIETAGKKDPEKMKVFVDCVRGFGRDR